MREEMLMRLFFLFSTGFDKGFDKSLLQWFHQVCWEA